MFAQLRMTLIHRNHAYRAGLVFFAGQFKGANAPNS